MGVNESVGEWRTTGVGGRCLWFPFQHGGWRTLPAAEGPFSRAPRAPLHSHMLRFHPENRVN